VWPESFTFVGMLNACASVVVLEEGWCAHEQIFQSRWDSNSLWGIAWWASMQNVGALKMLGLCSSRYHLKMWSL